MNDFPKKIMKLDEKNKFNNLNNLYPSLQTTNSHRDYTKLNMDNMKLFDEKNKTISSQRSNYKIKKFKSNLILDNNTSKNLSKTKNLFKESNIRNKSNDNKANKILKTKKKSIIRSKIFDNMNIKNHNIEKIDNKLNKNQIKLDDNKNNLKAPIKVNIKKRKDNILISKNKKIGKNKNMRPCTKSENKKIIYNYKNEENKFFNKNMPKCNNNSQEIFYNNKMNKILFIQNFWRKYLYQHKNFDINSERFSIINQAFIKLKKCIYSYYFKLLKNEIFNIRYYLHFWHNKIYLYKILQKIIYLRKNKFKEIQKIIKMKNPNLSSRQKGSNFNRFKSFNNNKNEINYTNFSSIKDNLSYLDNISLSKKFNNFNQNATLSSFSNINSIRKIYNNKSTEKQHIKTKKNKVINKNNKYILKDIFKNNEINCSTFNTITPSNKVIKYTNTFYNKTLNFNNINDYNEQLNKNNNKTFRKILNRNILLNKTILSNNYIYDEINITNPNSSNNRKSKKQHIILTNIYSNNSKTIFKDNSTVKKRFYKLKKFDTCPMSIFNKKTYKLFIIKSKINKCFNHWINITFKTKLIKYLITEQNKIKLRNLFFRRTVRIILDFFQIIILKIYFDKYNNKAIQTGLLLKLRSFILKNNKFKKYLDLSNKEKINYIEIKGVDVINNININNFVNYNNTNKIIPLEKNNNILNNYTLGNALRFPLTFINDEPINIINSKNNKNIKIKNMFSKGIFIAQINQLRMIFNLIDKHVQNNINIKNYFEIWKKKARKNYKKINIINQKCKSELNRYIKINKNKIYSSRGNSRFNGEKKDKFQNNIKNRLIENENKKKIDNSSELSLAKKQINSEIIYTKKILNHNNQIFNNNLKFNNSFLKINQPQKKINKIEEREVHFNYLITNKNNSFAKTIENEIIHNTSDKLTESSIKNKISKIKIEFLENPNQKNKKKGNIDYNNIYENIKKSFTKKFRTIDYKIVNQTFCCPLVNYLDEI